MDETDIRNVLESIDPVEIEEEREIEFVDDVTQIYLNEISATALLRPQ